MGLQATIYRWDDPGAPQITNKTQAEWLAMLKACLVDGYGDKQGAGWSVAFEDIGLNKLVLKNSASEASGGYAVFWAYNATNLIAVKTAPLITEISPTWESVANSSYRHVFRTSYPKKWIIVATSAGFYITTSGVGANYDDMSQGTYEFPCFFVGDIQSYYVGDANVFTVLTPNLNGDYTNGSWSRALGYTNNGNTITRLGEVDGNGTQVNIRATTFFRASISSIINGEKEVTALSHVTLQTEKFSAHSTSIGYVDSEGTNFNESTLQPAVRGQIPGFLQSSVIGFSDSKWPVTRVFDDIEHVLIPSPHNGGCCYWVSCGEWYA